MSWKCLVSVFQQCGILPCDGLCQMFCYKHRFVYSKAQVGCLLTAIYV